MKSLLKAAALSSALVMSSSVYSFEMPDMTGYYYHAQYAMLNVDISNVDGSGSADSQAVALEIGTNIYKHELADIFLEGVAILGFEDGDAFGDNSNRYTGGIDAAIGVQVKAHRRFTEEFAGFFNLGLMNITTTVTEERSNGVGWVASAPIADTTETGLTYSLGAEYMLNATSGLTLSYSNLFSGDVGASEVDVTSINLGYKANF